MRAFVPRPYILAMVGLAAALCGRAQAQSEPASTEPPGTSNRTEQPEEITVRGEKTLERYRLDLAAAREDLVEAYNDANSTDKNDVVCRNERVTGTRMPQRICRSKAQSEAEASASMNFLRSMTHSSGRYPTPPVAGAAPPEVLPAVNASIGAANAQSGAEMLSAESRAAIEAELETLRRENRQVYRAIVKYLELLDEYNAARGATAQPH